MDRSCAERAQIKDRSWFICVWARIHLEIREFYGCWRAYHWARNREYVLRQAEKRKDGLLRSNCPIIYILYSKQGSFFLLIFIHCAQICEKLEDGLWTAGRDEEGPYIKRGDQWVGYEDPLTVKIKVAYVRSVKLGGVSLWSLDLDDFQVNNNKLVFSSLIFLALTLNIKL